MVMETRSMVGSRVRSGREEQEKTFGGDRCVHYLGLIGEYMCQNSLNYMLCICVVYCVSSVL